MLMRKGEHWTCMNPFCGGSVTLRASYYSRKDPPRCPCGSPLRFSRGQQVSITWSSCAMSDRPPLRNPKKKNSPRSDSNICIHRDTQVSLSSRSEC